MKKNTVASGAVAGASFFRSVKMVLWSFLGVRKSSEWQQDAAKTSPFHIIFVGFAGVIFLVAGLVLLVNWVVPG